MPDINKAFAKIYRVLKPVVSFGVSDVVIKGDLPEKIRKDAEMYAGCVSGILKWITILTLSIKTDSGTQLSISKRKLKSRRKFF